MLKKRKTDNCDYDNCPVSQRADLTDANVKAMYEHFNTIHNRLDIGADKMRELSKDVQTNRKWDKLIFLIGFISLGINLLRG